MRPTPRASWPSSQAPVLLKRSKCSLVTGGSHGGGFGCACGVTACECCHQTHTLAATVAAVSITLWAESICKKTASLCVSLWNPSVRFYSPILSLVYREHTGTGILLKQCSKSDMSPWGREDPGSLEINQRFKWNVTDDSNGHEEIQICLKRTNNIALSKQPCSC